MQRSVGESGLSLAGDKVQPKLLPPFMNTCEARDNALTDEQLIAQVVQHNENALEELHRRHCSLLRPIIMRITNDHMETEDVMQDVFLQLWNQGEKFSADKGHLKAWLITLARRRALDHVRQRSAYQRATHRYEEQAKQEEQQPSAVPSSVDDEVRHHELQCLLENIIDTQLPTDQGEVVRLTFLQGLSQRQIAAQLALPLGTVKTRIELGMRKLSRSNLLKQAA